MNNTDNNNNNDRAKVRRRSDGIVGHFPVGAPAQSASQLPSAVPLSFVYTCMYIYIYKT